MGGVHLLMLVMGKYMSRNTSIMGNRKQENAVGHFLSNKTHKLSIQFFYSLLFDYFVSINRPEPSFIQKITIGNINRCLTLCLQVN